jgi:hypothetical protein
MTDCDDIRAARLLGDPLGSAAAAHVRGCARCRADEAVVVPLARALAAEPAAAVPGLTGRVLTAAAPLLAAQARRAARVRLARALAAALVPLPAIVLLDLSLVRAAYHALSAVLPHAVSLYVVGNYAAFLALLLALTYGAIPFLAARQGGITPGGPHV